MAEYIEQRLEKLIPQIEELKRLRLYTDAETKSILTKRTHFEYKIQRHETEMHHFLNYIEYEMNILEDIRLRRIKYDIKGSKQLVEYSIHKTILRLYEEALKKYRHEISLWMSAISFAEQCAYTSKIESFMKRLLETHPKSVPAWQMAIVYEKKHKTTDEVRTLLLKSLQFNPESESLHREAFTFELNSAAESKSNKLVEIIFRSAVKNIDNIEFLCDLIDMSDNFDPTQRLATSLIDILRTKYENNELFWHSLAVRELCGKHYCVDNPEQHEKTTLSQMDRYLNARDMYQQGIQRIKTPLMFEYYLDIMLNAPECQDDRLKYNMLKDTFELSRNRQENLLLPRHYLKLTDLTESICEKKEILRYATKQFPSSASLWAQLLCVEIQTNSDIEKTFRHAIDSLGEDALPLWQIILKYYKDQSNCKNKIESLYLEAVTSKYDKISDGIVIDYLKWAQKTSGLKYARKVFQTIILNKLPFSKLIKTMIQLECSSETAPSVKKIEHLLELGVNVFGDRDLDIWLDLVRLQLVHKPLAVPLTVQQVKMKLKSDLYKEFLNKFEALKLEQLETNDFSYFIRYIV